jgi:hypothetical protein
MSLRPLYKNLLLLSKTAQQVRRSAQVLRSFEKQCQAKLPTCALIINENAENCAE